MTAVTTKGDTNRSFAKRGKSKQFAAEQSQTVWAVTYDLLRALKLTTFFGNPGSTELTFLKAFPSDFQYILGLQEASAVAMADGFAQATRRPALVNLHTGAGVANGMCSIMTAFLNKTPLIITAGQQMRKMIISDPYLTNRDETMLPRPWVKWAYRPARAQDVPGAIMRAYAMALQPPSGPVFVSIPLDDWDRPALGRAVVRTVSTRFAPDGDRLREFAQRISASKKLALIYGQEIDRSGGWDAGVALAEKLNAPVFHAPDTERPSFPETHRLFQGMLPMAMGPLSDRLKGFDLAAVIGATVFVVDLFDRTVALDGESIALAPFELSVLTVLASRPGRVTTFGDILAGVGRAGSASGRQALRMSVFRLRRRIERDPKHPVLLLTEAGVGYRLAPESVDHLNFEARTPQHEGNGAGSP
jgi:DNA-binding winged helix-turn-helix (wHTH) protein